MGQRASTKRVQYDIINHFNRFGRGHVIFRRKARHKTRHISQAVRRKIGLQRWKRSPHGGVQFGPMGAQI